MLFDDFMAYDKISFTLQIIVIVLGVIEMCLVFLVEKLGPVFRVTIALHGITSGTLLGLFSMGILFRKTNTKVTTV